MTGPRRVSGAGPYEATENQFSVDRFVYEGSPWTDRSPRHSGGLFDRDDPDRGRSRGRDPREGASPNSDGHLPLRAEIETDIGASVFRIASVDPKGSHGFDAPDPDEAVDVHSFMTDQIGHDLSRAGGRLRDDPCMRDVDTGDCDFFEQP